MISDDHSKEILKTLVRNCEKLTTINIHDSGLNGKWGTGMSTESGTKKAVKDIVNELGYTNASHNKNIATFTE